MLSVVCNLACLTFVERALTAADVADRDVLEVGSYDVDGSARQVIAPLGPRCYTGVDLESGPGVDEVVDASALVARFAPDSFDVVVSTEMIEHVRDWRTAISNLKQVVRPGGTLVITTRSEGFDYHGFPADFWRYQTEDFARIFDDLEIELLEDDPTSPGVFIKARKPLNFQPSNLDDVALYSILARRRVLALDRRLEWAYLIRCRSSQVGRQAAHRWLPGPAKAILRKVRTRLRPRDQA